MAQGESLGTATCPPVATHWLQLVHLAMLSWGVRHGAPGSGTSVLAVTHPAEHQGLCYHAGLGGYRATELCLVVGNQPHMGSSVSLPTSCPEDRGHEEEAAALHRALQVAPQLPQPLVRLLLTGVRCAHQPGTWGAGGA